MIPSFMLRQLYVKGSLQNIKENNRLVGFSFKLRNNLGSGTIKGSLELIVDGKNIDPNAVKIKKGSEEFSLKDLESKAVPFDVGDEITFEVKKENGLSEGMHNITIVANTLEYGKVDISFSDEIK